MKLTDFIAIDIESTGLDPEKDEIIEIAMVRFKDHQAQDTFSTLIKPAQTVRPFILKLTGITADELESAPDFATASAQIAEFMGDLPLVAHNAMFDSRFLRTAFANVDRDISANQFFDSLLLARLAWPLMPNHRLETLISELGIVREQSHRALPDAQACGEMFVMAWREYEKFSPLTKYHLAQLSRGSEWEQLFGNFTEVPTDTVVRPAPASSPEAVEATKPDLPWRIKDWYGADKILAKNIPGYANCNGQNDFAGIVERNMFRGGVAVIESAPGINTTQSYLVPALLKIAQGSDKLVISTGSRSSQSQVESQLAQLAPLFGAHIKVAPLKQRNHYLCLRKFNEHLQHADLLLTAEEKLQIMPLLPWLETTQTGDATENNGFNLNRNRQLWYKIQSDAPSSLGEACEFYEQCFARNARARAEAANVILINHQLLVENLHADLALMPRYEHCIVTDAHNLTALSHRILGKKIWFFRFRNQVKILAHTKDEEKGVLAVVEKLTPAEQQAALKVQCDGIRTQINECEKQIHRFFVKIGKSIKKQDNKSSLRYLYSMQAEFQADSKPMLAELEELEKRLETLISAISTGGTELKNWGRNMEAILNECVRFRKDLDFASVGSREDWSYWLEEPGNPHTLVIQNQPLHVQFLWINKLYKWTSSVLLTSNNLTVEGTFDYFTWKMGLKSRNLPKEKLPFVRSIATPWDLNAMRKVVLVNFLPNPNDKNFQKELDALLGLILPTSPRSALALYTSQNSLIHSHKNLEKAFAKQDRLLLSQDSDGTLHNLLDLYRSEAGACLLANQNSAESIFEQDIKVDMLILSKIPFPSPGDALLQAQGEVIKERNGNPFRDIFMPSALSEMRLSMDNLFKSPQDRSIILILDNRISSEKYGRSITKLWNNKHVVANTFEDLQRILSQ